MYGNAIITDYPGYTSRFERTFSDCQRVCEDKTSHGYCYKYEKERSPGGNKRLPPGSPYSEDKERVISYLRCVELDQGVFYYDHIGASFNNISSLREDILGEGYLCIKSFSMDRMGDEEIREEILNLSVTHSSLVEYIPSIVKEYAYELTLRDIIKKVKINEGGFPDATPDILRGDDGVVRKRNYNKHLSESYGYILTDGKTSWSNDSNLPKMKIADLVKVNGDTIDLICVKRVNEALNCRDVCCQATLSSDVVSRREYGDFFSSIGVDVIGKKIRYVILLICNNVTRYMLLSLAVTEKHVVNDGFEIVVERVNSE